MVLMNFLESISSVAVEIGKSQERGGKIWQLRKCLLGNTKTNLIYIVD